ncbi:MAG TPA: hypothetical protein VN905_08245 [Candidatus Binatia bacterium]|nr:hypothetical protein [Candidatus Binatia bacterium]
MIPRRRRGRPPRAFLSWSLIIGSVVLLMAIIIGNQLGDRVLSQVTEQTRPLPTPVMPSAVPTQSQAPQSWKQVQVTAVATDPHFPDPRVTPPPPPTPRPTRRPTPAPIPSAPTPAPSSTPTSNFSF